jgi:hypothetical protein
MNAEIFAEWMRRQGHKTIRTPSSYWYDAGPRVLQAFPYHWLLQPSKNEINDLMSSYGIICLRYSTPIEFPDGKISYHIILQQPYTLDLMKSQARNGVKRGLERAKVLQVSFERLATEGWILQQDTLDRQNRLRSMTQADWEKVCRSAFDLPGFEAWAAEIDGKMAAALITCQIEDTWCVPFALSHRKYQADHVNNAIFFEVSTNILAREGINEIFFTLQSLDAPPTVDDFKLRMGLMPKPVRQRVDFHPALKLLTTRGVHKMIVGLQKKRDDNPLIAKAEGMLRFNIEGKLPVRQQNWPECISHRKEELIHAIERNQAN